MFCHDGSAAAPFEVSNCFEVPSPESVCSAVVDDVPPVTTVYEVTAVPPMPPEVKK